MARRRRCNCCWITEQIQTPASAEASSDQNQEDQYTSGGQSDSEAATWDSSAAQSALDELKVDKLVAPDRLAGTLQTVLMLSVISLAPAILLMTTSFVRIAIVLGVLRQALGAQQIPSTQVITAL